MISKNQLKFYSSLKEKKHREQEGYLLIEGLRLCEEAVAANLNFKTLLYISNFPTTDRSQKLIAACQKKNILCEEIPTKALDKLADTKNPQGVVAIVKKPERNYSDFLASNPQTIIALFEINDPGNLGTILRTANWFGVDGVILSTNSVEYTNPKVVRASMGSAFHLPIFENAALSDFLNDLKQQGYSLYYADSNTGTNFHDVTYAKKSVLILNGETAEIDEDIKQVSHEKIIIPGEGKSDSLNVAIAAGIILSEINQKRN